LIKRNTFRRHQRLSAKADFERVFAEPNKTTSKSLLALWKLGNSQCGRIAIIAGKKTVPSAVIRNQIRRIIRDSYRQALISTVNLDLIVIIRQPCQTLRKLDIRKEIDSLWTKLLKQSQSI